MGKSAYPTANDLKARLYAANLITDASAATTLSGAETAGSNVSLDVVSSSGFAVGDAVAIGAGATCEIQTVSAIADSTHLTVSALTNNQAAGARVQRTTLNSAPWTGVDFASLAIAARQAFEEATGRVMLAVSAARTFDPPTLPSTKLNLRRDMAGAPSALTVGGVSKTLNTDYYLHPENASDDGKPFRVIEFANYLPQTRKSVVVTALWGYGATIPDDAWRAMLDSALAQMGPEIGAAFNASGVKAWTAGDEKREFGTEGAFAAELGRAETSYKAAVCKYKDVMVGF